MAIFGDRLLRCSDGHVFVSGEGERLLGSIHLGWWRMMQCRLTGGFASAATCPKGPWAPRQLDDLQHYGQSPAPSGTAAPPPESEDDELHRVQVLAKLEELLDGGALTQAEFDAEKQRVLQG